MGFGWIIWLVLLGVVTLVWVSRHWDIAQARREQPPLSSESFDGPPENPPRISVIIAAKDEEENIETCVRTMMDQDYPDFELIVVNDRSTDRTGAILDELAAEYKSRGRGILRPVPDRGGPPPERSSRPGSATDTSAWDRRRSRRDPSDARYWLRGSP